MTRTLSISNNLPNQFFQKNTNPLANLEPTKFDIDFQISIISLKDINKTESILRYQ
jgi:hypothetical protein